MQTGIFNTIQKAFDEATTYTFRKMIMVNLSPLGSGENKSEEYDYCGYIGFSGKIIGECLLKLSRHTAREAASRFAGETIDDSVDISDCVGELVNMITGNAKAAMQKGVTSLSIPKVFSGDAIKQFHIRHPGFIQLFYESEIGKIEVVVSFSHQE